MPSIPSLPRADQALPGRSLALEVLDRHFVTGQRIKPPFDGYDLALFGRAVMQLPAYRQVAATKTYTFPGGTDRSGKVSPAFEIQNHNQLLENYPGTIGVKNGYTTGARNTFIGAVTRGGRTLLITQMGATLTPSWQRQAALLDWAFANAGQLRPVGTLVAPGAAQPPELGGTPAPTTAGTPVPSATTNEPIPTATTSLPPVVAAEGIGPGGNPGPWLLASAGTAARNPITWLVVVVVGLGVILGLRRWVRRAGPED